MDRRLMNTKYLQSQLHALHAIHRRDLEEYGDLVQSLDEECAILCDVIPSYKIRDPLKHGGGDGDGDDDEKVPQQKQKKEVHQVEVLETEILTQYQHFLQLLKKLRRKPHPEQQALGSRLCARLVRVAADFNNNKDLLTIAVDFANAKASRAAIPALEALTALLDGEMVSEPAQHVVDAIAALVRREEHALNPKLLGLLLHIRVAMIDMHRPDIAEAKAKDKRQKKEDKELARLLQKSKGRRDRAEIAARQTKIIHKIFSVYLRVVQVSKSCPMHHQTRILAPTLEGLAKFAPLINLELYQLLMKALNEILDDENTAVTTKLHALVAVACLAQKESSGTDATQWRTDLDHHHTVLFSCLQEALRPPEPDSSRSAKDAAAKRDDDEGSADDAASLASSSTTGTLSSRAFSIAASMAEHKFVQSSAAREWTYRCRLALRAVDLLFLTQRHIPQVRVVGVTRRLLQNAAVCPPHIQMALLVLVHKIIVKYPATAAIVIGGNDYATSGRGGYDPESNDLHTCNAETSFAWEDTLLRRMYHPTARMLAGKFLEHYHVVSQSTGSMTGGRKRAQGAAATAGTAVTTRALDALSPYDVLEQYDSSTGAIQPTPPNPASRFRRSATGAATTAAAGGPKLGVKRPREEAPAAPEVHDDEEEED